uniref:Uncharacterized protein n=1 Tax=Tetranychus urticae TaxID=32264 RepID=T1KRA9_TETUR
MFGTEIVKFNDNKNDNNNNDRDNKDQENYNWKMYLKVKLVILQTSKALASTSSNIDIVGIISFLREGGGRAANSGASSVIGSFTVCTEASLHSPRRIKQLSS